MSARLLLLALGSTLLTACPGKATHITDATRGFIKQRESERHYQFKGAEPVDINTLAAVVITAVGATQTASRSYPIPGCDSGRALCVRTSRGGATQRGPGLDDNASTLDDQSQPWWTAKAKKLNQRRFLFTPKREDATVAKGKAARGLASIRTASVSEGLSGGGWILLAAAVLLGGSKPNVGEQEGSSPTKIVSPVNGWSSKPSTVAKKRSAMSRAGQGGDRASRLQALVPENPYARAIGVVAIAVLGSCGLYLLKTREILLAAWPTTLVESWQVLTAIAWAINMRVTLVEGRLDGSGQANPSKARRQQPGFFTPASWAFTIWAPIILGEVLFVLYQLLPLPSIRGSWWLYDVCPWFCGAMLFQSLWCASFRPWARDIGLLWLPALLLGGTAIALGRAHRVLRIAWFAGDIELPQYIIAHLPLSLHFGWISCASLVNLNGYFASVTSLSNRAKLALSLTTVVAAVILGGCITLLTEDPVFPGVVAWALWAVGSEGGWRNLKGRVDPGAIRTQELVAKAGSIVSLAVASAPIVVHLMDVIVGGGEAN